MTAPLTGWRLRWAALGGGSIPSRVPCASCHLAHDHADLCAECCRCRACAPRPWRPCGQSVAGCGPYCGACEPHHTHPAPG